MDHDQAIEVRLLGTLGFKTQEVLLDAGSSEFSTMTASKYEIPELHYPKGRRSSPSKAVPIKRLKSPTSFLSRGLIDLHSGKGNQ